MASAGTQHGYSRVRLVAMLLVIGGVILADHIGSPTFRMNMGEGGFETALTQRAAQSSGCAPCGAPCRDDDREGAADAR